MNYTELKLGDKINICGYSTKFVGYDGEYFCFKHEWSPSVFLIKMEDIKNRWENNNIQKDNQTEQR